MNTISFFLYNILGEIMNYEILVNKDNLLDKNYIPNALVFAKSNYKDDILLNEKALENFNLMKDEAQKLGYNIDIMSGYRDYAYQEKLYNNSIREKGFAYTFRSVAMPGASEHQTGLAIDICIYNFHKLYNHL